MFGKWEWISYSLSHQFSYLHNLNDDRNKIKNDFKENEILLISEIWIRKGILIW